MKKEKVNELTAALESAGFEIVALREETYQYLVREQGGTFHSGDDRRQDNEPTGTVIVELKTIV
jgi:inosine/xanthosine triphosphate pyrophosphatase family protein